MKTAVQIVGWHPRWEKIASIKAIRISSDCGLADAKRVVDRALTEEFAEFEVEGLEEAKRVSQELADLGAVVSCAQRLPADTADHGRPGTGTAGAL